MLSLMDHDAKEGFRLIILVSIFRWLTAVVRLNIGSRYVLRVKVCVLAKGCAGCFNGNGSAYAVGFCSLFLCGDDCCTTKKRQRELHELSHQPCEW